jgi:hypothetical protein
MRLTFQRRKKTLGRRLPMSNWIFAFLNAPTQFGTVRPQRLFAFDNDSHVTYLLSAKSIRQKAMAWRKIIIPTSISREPMGRSHE